jgi:hypothetical protein
MRDTTGMTMKKPPPPRWEILNLLMERWGERPDMTLGQVIAHFCYVGAGHTDVSYLTDEEMLAALRRGWVVL